MPRFHGLSGDLGPADATACVVHSDTPRTGSFECSSTEVNQLYANIDWGQRGNFISIPTDCPQRDERLGWLGDAQIFVRTAAYNRDVASFFSKWLDDVTDAQLPSGAFTDFAPRLGHDWAGRAGVGGRGRHRPLDHLQDVRRHRRYWSGTSEPWRPGWTSWPRATRPVCGRNSSGNNYGDWLAPKGDFTPRELSPPPTGPTTPP